MSTIDGQIETLATRLAETLPGNLLGIYLHGSCATGSFETGRSDVDLLVVLHRSLTAAERGALLALLLGISNRPAPLEISFMTVDQVRSEQHPAAYELHFSEAHRATLEAGTEPSMPSTDPDLAIHIAVLRQRGRRLRGAAIADVFPWVPREHLLDGLRQDFEWAAPQAARQAHYLLANAARTLAYLEDARLRSKAEALADAERWLPPRFAPLARAARAHQSLDTNEVAALAELVIRRLRSVA